jgi:hypothetical protein
MGRYCQGIVSDALPVFCRRPWSATRWLPFRRLGDDPGLRRFGASHVCDRFAVVAFRFSSASFVIATPGAIAVSPKYSAFVRTLRKYCFFGSNANSLMLLFDGRTILSSRRTASHAAMTQNKIGAIGPRVLFTLRKAASNTVLIAGSFSCQILKDGRCEGRSKETHGLLIGRRRCRCGQDGDWHDSSACRSHRR